MQDEYCRLMRLPGGSINLTEPEGIYKPITAMGFSTMFTFQLTTLRSKNCCHPIAVMEVVDMFGLTFSPICEMLERL